MPFDSVLTDCSQASSTATPRNKRKQSNRSPRYVQGSTIQLLRSDKQPSLEIVTPTATTTPQRHTPAAKKLRLVPQSPEIPPRSSKKASELPSKSSEISVKRISVVPESPEIPARSSKKSADLPSQASVGAEEYVYFFFKPFISLTIGLERTKTLRRMLPRLKLQKKTMWTMLSCQKHTHSSRTIRTTFFFFLKHLLL
jgi:hypothetical protein